MVGIDNFLSLGSNEKLSPEYINCRYRSLLSPRKYYNKHLTAEKGWEWLLREKPVYFLSANPDIIAYKKKGKKGKLFYEMEVEVLKKVKNSQMFEQVPLPEYPEVLLFKYKGRHNPSGK